MITLRPYQTQITDEARSHLRRGVKSVLIQSPTGSGKTALTASMLSTAASRGKRSWFIVHRRELVKQSCRAFSEIGTPCGVVAASFQPEPRQLIQTCSVDTLRRRLDKIAPPDMIVWDECHHAVSASWSKIFKQFPNAVHIGLTATPERTDGRGLGDHFEVMVQGPTTADLIEQGYLSPYVYYAPPAATMDMRTRMGDYDRQQSAKKMDRPSITGDAVMQYLKVCRGKRAVCFAVNREHSRHVAAKFAAFGVPAEHVDGETPQEERDAALERFAAGETLVLTNVDLFGEGFDLPSIEAAILLRPTKSLALYLQQVGRALRTSPGKEQAYILDHAGNVKEFGYPDDERDWSLDSKPRSKRKGEPSPSVRICPKCFMSMPGCPPKCSDCGHVFEIQAREVEEVAGELEEITPEERKRMRRMKLREQARAESYDDLVELGKSRGYKNPEKWAEHVYQSRRRKAVSA